MADVSLPGVGLSLSSNVSLTPNTVALSALGVSLTDNVSLVGYNPAAIAIFNSFTTPATTARKNLINQTVVALINAGIWADLDVLYMLAAADSQAARINWKAPGTFTCSLVGGGPTFQADRGFTGNGSTQALDTGYTPSTQGVKYTQNDASAWAWDLTAAEEDGASDVGNATAPRLKLAPRGTGSTSLFRINDNTDQSNPSSSALGFWGAQRRGATDKRTWMNGAQVGTTANTASTGLPAQSQWICGANSSLFSVHQMSAAAWGSSLNGLEAAFYTAVSAYMTGVGIVPAGVGPGYNFSLASNSMFITTTAFG